MQCQLDMSVPMDARHSIFPSNTVHQISIFVSARECTHWLVTAFVGVFSEHGVYMEPIAQKGGFAVSDTMQNSNVKRLK